MFPEAYHRDGAIAPGLCLPVRPDVADHAVGRGHDQRVRVDTAITMRDAAQHGALGHTCRTEHGVRRRQLVQGIGAAKSTTCTRDDGHTALKAETVTHRIVRLLLCVAWCLCDKVNLDPACFLD